MLLLYDLHCDWATYHSLCGRVFCLFSIDVPVSCHPVLLAPVSESWPGSPVAEVCPPVTSPPPTATHTAVHEPTATPLSNATPTELKSPPSSHHNADTTRLSPLDEPTPTKHAPGRELEFHFHSVSLCENVASSLRGTHEVVDILDFDLCEVGDTPGSPEKLIPMEPVEEDIMQLGFREPWANVQSGKALKGQWYAYLESFKTFPTLFNAASQDLDSLTILRKTEVKVASDEVDLSMTFNLRCLDRVKDSDVFLDRDTVLQKSISTVLHE